MAHRTTSERDAYLRRLEKELEAVDVERAAKLNGIMTDYGLQIRKLRFLPSETAMRLLQVIRLYLLCICNNTNSELLKDECVNANLCMLENRESIVQYTSVLRAMNIEMNRMIENCFDGYGKNWHQARYDHLFGTASQDFMAEKMSLLLQRTMTRKSRQSWVKISKSYFKNSRKSLTCNFRSK